MSKVRQASGDDHAEAATKHLRDAAALLAAGRSDGAAYLSGYVVECALKTLFLYEATPIPTAQKWGNKGHDLSDLEKQVATQAVVAGAKTAKYYGAATRGLAAAAIAAWFVELRYRSAHLTQAVAQVWFNEADAVYRETIGAMYLDGVL